MNALHAACFTFVCLCTLQVQPAESDNAVNPYADLVPQQLLALLHAPEVHRELALTADQVQELERLFSETDGPWFRSRILPPEKQREIMNDLESRVHRWLLENASAKQRQRLQQLEYQAQGTRSLLRKDLAGRLGLKDSQRQQLAELARATDTAQRRLRSAKLRGEAIEEFAADVLASARAEHDELKDIVLPDQRRKLSFAIGEAFDTSGLERIYPMAPDFEPVKHWLNTEPLNLQQLRGKVVLIHFYAFQCHNCHANFENYRRWHEGFSNEDVVVIGIQTPETSRERDLEAIRAAAMERELTFPILVDLDSKNWNAWGNTMWPTLYVVDQDGYLRHWWQGELNWQGATGDETIENLVNKLLRENAPGS